MKVKEIYNLLNKKVNVSAQEKWDNSGFLAGDEAADVKKVVFALDITSGVVEYAAENNAEIIISHHPVIFDAIKNVRKDSVVYKLISNDISAICLHTPLDIAECGMNKILYNKFKDGLGLKDGYDVLEVTQNDGTGFGFVARLEKSTDATETAQIVAESLDESDVRLYNCGTKTSVIAVCSGSGSSMLEYAKNLGADTFITGDVKQDRWIAAENIKMNLIDAGHFGTEKFFYEPLKEMLNGKVDCLVYEKKPYETILNRKACDK